MIWRQNGQIHLLDGKSHQIHGRFGRSAHGVDITQGIGGSNLPEPIWVIHDGCKEIHRLNQCQIIRNLVYAGIICPFQADDHIFVAGENQTTQRPIQVPRRQFGRSAGPADRLCQTDFVRICHGTFGRWIFRFRPIEKDRTTR